MLIPQFSRDWTEPECDREYRKAQKMKNDDLENITGEQLQEELDKIIRDYKEKKQQKQVQSNEKVANKKFIINV